MKKSNRILISIAFFLLVFSLLATVIETVAFREQYYVNEYAKNSAQTMTGMDDEDLIASTITLLDYLKDKRDDIVIEAEVNGVTREVFNTRETIHMVDVKDLYQNFQIVRNISVVIGIVLLAISVMREKSKRKLLQFGYQYGSFAVLGVVVMIAIWALADFTTFWTSFHEFFFQNDYWLLDPNTSIMINMFPENFWFDLVIQIIVVFVIAMSVLWIVLFIPKRRKND